MAILIVESDTLIAKQYSQYLTKYSYEVVIAHTAQQAIDELDSRSPKFFKLIILDISLPGNNGVELIYELRSYEDWLNIPILVLSSLPPKILPFSNLESFSIVDVLYKPNTKLSDVLKYIPEEVSNEKI